MRQKKLIITSLTVALGLLICDLLNLQNYFLSYQAVEIGTSILFGGFLIAVITLLFSLLTYRSDTTFQYWWKFAKFGIPVTFLLIIAINLGLLNSPTQGSLGWGGIFNDVINFYASLIIYATFIIGSLIQITRGYLAALQK